MLNIDFREIFDDESIASITTAVLNKIDFDISQEFKLVLENKLSNFIKSEMSLESSELVKLCRLFMGTASLATDDGDILNKTLDSVFDKMFIDQHQTFDLDQEQMLNLKKDSIVEFIAEFTDIKFEDELEESIEINNFLIKEFRNNPGFYNKILNEVEHYYVYQVNQNYMSAFVHLYRIYEYVSYAFPLTYVQNSTDFMNSYKELQQFFGTDEKGEDLKFFERFINQVFLKSDYISEELYEQSVEININTSEYDNVKRTIFSSVINELNKKKSSINTILRNNGAQPVENVAYFNDENSSLQISTLAFHGFIIVLRNKIFHFKASRQDALYAQNIYFEDLFKIMNAHIYNWIAMIFKFVVYSSIENRS